VRNILWLLGGRDTPRLLPKATWLFTSSWGANSGSSSSRMSTSGGWPRILASPSMLGLTLPSRPPSLMAKPFYQAGQRMPNGVGRPCPYAPHAGHLRTPCLLPVWWTRTTEAGEIRGEGGGWKGKNVVEWGKKIAKKEKIRRGKKIEEK
jgi:hypothetical protein